jgi:cytochrome c biogenesis protein
LRAVEMLSSMRFAIALLTVICIASVIGTVLKQHEPLQQLHQPVRAVLGRVFMAASLTAVYSAWWFLLILAFLVTSTSLCIARNTPKILVDLKHLQGKHPRAEPEGLPPPRRGVLGRNARSRGAPRRPAAGGGGWKVKLQQRGRRPRAGWMVAAKAGAVNKLGYIAAHSAIVLVCIGGLLDGDLMVRAQMLFTGKSAYTGGGMIADVPPEHRLPPNNPTFRGNMLVAEGTQSSTPS